MHELVRAFALVAVAAATVLPARADSAPLTIRSATAGKIAFGKTGEHGRDIGEIYVMNPDGTGQRNLTRHTGDDHSYRWSPDGRRIVFVRQDRRPRRQDHWINVYVMNADGSAVRRLTSTKRSDGPAWSPDGRRIAFLRAGRLHVMNANGTGARRIAPRTFYPEQPEWSAKGKLAFIRDVDGVATSTWSVNPDGSRLRRLSRNRLGDEGLAWSPSGEQLAFVRRRKGGLDLVAAIFVIAAEGGVPRRLTPWSAETISASFAFPAWSPDGRRIAFVGGRGALYSIGADSRGLRRLTQRGAWTPTWSPDGQRLAFTRGPAIFVVNADGTGERRLVPKPGKPVFSERENWSPRWSPTP